MDGGDAEEVLCLICCDPIDTYCIPQCDHCETCALCSTRMRDLMRDLRCIACQVESESVVYSKKRRPFADFGIYGKVATKAELFYDEATAAFFSDRDHLEAAQSLSERTCNVCTEAVAVSAATKSSSSQSVVEGGAETENADTDLEGGTLSSSSGKRATKNKDRKKKQVGVMDPEVDEFRNMEALQTHLKDKHRLSFCPLCLEHRKVFLQEQTLFKQNELQQHLKKGDPASGFKGHPYCKFCKQHYFGDTELGQHLRRDHFNCFVCVEEGRNANVFFADYQSLELHFDAEHFCCEEPECRLQKFVVFSSGAALRSHMEEVHGFSSQAAASLPVLGFKRGNSGGGRNRGQGQLEVMLGPPPASATGANAGSVTDEDGQDATATAFVPPPTPPTLDNSNFPGLSPPPAAALLANGHGPNLNGPAPGGGAHGQQQRGGRRGHGGHHGNRHPQGPHRGPPVPPGGPPSGAGVWGGGMMGGPMGGMGGDPGLLEGPPLPLHFNPARMQQVQQRRRHWASVAASKKANPPPPRLMPGQIVPGLPPPGASQNQGAGAGASRQPPPPPRVPNGRPASGGWQTVNPPARSKAPPPPGPPGSQQGQRIPGMPEGGPAGNGAGGWTKVGSAGGKKKR
uniref:C2H2-type domain-containing protein n=1 Tax=Chromera velia CCMP2878 TaxID=1169474 RepID=A0A0G4GHI6_9ALVE|eukprot:Cvel_662.t1-p1 / transcript=Cvel_662.t1 / gene=Cvel_662 / organism=Chromera_velia_CCMP2878 / gene_product=LIM domain and RING finger protein C1223.01, putative / transcript_product=LIM domain and RING finger protein C1223.01, putative / location=Cvel_scaffold20:119482-123788(-) / protein_length=625 / sequence_SO=supercontig / SO=protein_coding / is_pseudo=false